ncbi:MAG: hypothetical protein Kow0089_07000 [Desulfobulbaceae bacterium]
MTTEKACGRCAAMGRTCCQETDIFLTVGDLKRIAGRVGRLDFYEYRRPEDPLYLDQGDDPVWAGRTIRADNTRRVLKRCPNGDCLFLGGNGCVLSMDVRPLVCRLHPFTYTAAGLEGIDDPRCLAASDECGGELTTLFSMSYNQALLWHQQLYSEIFLDEERTGDEDRDHLRPAV